MADKLHPLLSLCVFVMMLCIGLDFSWPSWRRLLRAPTPLMVGILAQNIVIPVVGIGIAWLFRNTPSIALAIVLIVAAPGGPVSNAIVHYAGARIDLSVSLTALNGVLGLVTVPLIANWGFLALSGSGVVLKLPVAPTLLHLSTVVLLPILIGVGFQTFVPAVARRLSPLTRRGTMTMLVIILVIVFSANLSHIHLHSAQLILAALLLCVVMLFVSQLFARGFGLDPSMRFAIANEVSIHNVPLALLMAEVILGRSDLATFIIAYAPAISLTTFVWALWFKRKYSKSDSSSHLPTDR